MCRIFIPKWYHFTYRDAVFVEVVEVVSVMNVPYPLPLPLFMDIIEANYNFN